MNMPLNARSFSWLGRSGVLVCVPLLSGCVDVRRTRVEETQVIELMATDVKKVEALADNGAIVIRPSSGSDTIRVQAKIIARGRDEEDAQEALASVEIRTPRTGPNESVQEIGWGWSDNRQRHWSADVSFEIEMPAALKVHATTENGEIDVAGIEGDRQLESDNGSIELSDWTSKDQALWDGTMSANESTIVATTDNGQIEVESAASSVSISTENGGIKLRSAGKHVNLTTNNGGIQARLTTGERLDGLIRTDNGSVDLVINPEASTRLDCRSDSANVDISSLPIIEGSKSAKRRRFKGAIGSGAGLLEIETDNGSISVEGMPESGKVYH